MAREISNQVQYYYDSHPTEEDLMGETSLHVSLIDYFKAVLMWLFRDQVCSIYENLNFYQSLKYKEYPLAPDLAIIKDIPFKHVKSWTVGRTGPAPQVVFEILSEETWQKDVYEKPWKYARMGVQEYFAYDPYEPPISRATAKRLFGWLLNGNQEMVEIIPNAEGWMWSEQLASWLVPDGDYLRLYDRECCMRLNREEAQSLMVEQATERAAEEAERAQEATRRAEEEAKLAQKAVRRADEEARRAEEEAKRTQALAEKLRALGIDPDEVV